jgi:hypothetical protein
VATTIDSVADSTSEEFDTASRPTASGIHSAPKPISSISAASSRAWFAGNRSSTNVQMPSRPRSIGGA